jgi:hypothetical protein
MKTALKLLKAWWELPWYLKPAMLVRLFVMLPLVIVFHVDDH